MSGDRNVSGCPIEFICPITQELLRDPVLVSETGQTYERAAIQDWWARGHNTCPVTGTVLSSFKLAPNYVLRSLIQQQQPSTSYAPSPQANGYGMYPSMPQQPQQSHDPAESQLHQILQRLSSPSMQVAAYRSGSSYSLWQLESLVKDPGVHPSVMRAGILPTLTALLLDTSLEECQVHAARILQRLSVRSPPNCEAICKAGAISALVQMLLSKAASVRAAAASCLCLLGWNSSTAKADTIFSLCKSSKAATDQVSCINPLLPLFTSGNSTEVEAVSACLHMLSAAASPDVLATFELAQSNLARHLCKVLDSGTPPAAFAAAEALKAISRLPANKMEVLQQLLALMQSGCSAAQTDAANLCWELCCSNVHAPNQGMTAALSSSPMLLPALTFTLKSSDSTVVKAALGLVHVLALETLKAQNSFASPVNVDTVRLQITSQTPTLDCIQAMLTTKDASNEVAAADAAANLAAFRSGVCPECDKSSPSFKQQPSRKRDFFRVGRLHELDTSSTGCCKHNPRSMIKNHGIIQWLAALLESQDANVVSAVLIALYNISASEHLVDATSNGAETLQQKLLQLLSWSALSTKSKDAARMILQRLDIRDVRDQPSFTFLSAYSLPPSRNAVYIDP